MKGSQCFEDLPSRIIRMIFSFINLSWLSVARGSQGKTTWERRYVVLEQDRLSVCFSENDAASIELYLCSLGATPM